MAVLTDNVLFYDKTAAKYKTLNTTNDTIKLTVDTEFDANVVIKGQLIVKDQETVLISDNFLDLNSGYTTASAQAGGMTVNYSPTSTASTSTAFTAGSNGVANPIVAVASASGFLVNDIIQISSATDKANDGLYIIQAISSNNLSVYGVGTAGVPSAHEWAKNQFTTNTDDTAGAITKVAISIMKADTSGDWQVGKGSNTSSISYAAIQTGTDSSDTLQAAYEAGQTITTDANGALVFAGNQLIHSSSSGGFRVSTGALDVDSSADFDVTAFDVLVSGAGFSIDGAGASNVSTSSGAMTLSGAGGLSLQDGTATLSLASAALTSSALASAALAPSGAFDVDAGAAMTLDAASFTVGGDGDTGAIAMTATSAAMTLTAAGISLAGGSSEIDITTTGALDLNSAALTVTPSTMAINPSSTFDLDAAGAITVDGSSFSVGADGDTGAIAMTATSAAMTLTAAGINLAAGSSEVDITTTGALDANIGSLDLDSSGTVDIDGTVSTLNGSTALVLKNGSANLQIASGALTDGSMTSYSFAPSAAFNVTAGASSTVNVTGTLALVGSTGHSVVSTGGTYLLNAAGQTIDQDCAAFDLDSSGAVNIDGAAASTINVTGANLNLNTTTSGNIRLNPAGYTYNQGFISVNGNNPVTDAAAKIGIRMQAGESISAGEVLYIGNGGFFKADANTEAKAFPYAVAVESMSTGGTFYNAASLAGSYVKPIFDTAPGLSDLGTRVYLSETAGKVTLTPPTTSGAFQYQVGHLVYKDDTTTGNLIVWMPQFLAEVP